MVTMLDMVCVYLWICYDVHFVCKSALLLAACRAGGCGVIFCHLRVSKSRFLKVCKAALPSLFISSSSLAQAEMTK